MGELLNRDFQKHILQTLQDRYPDYTRINGFEDDGERRKWLVNVAYLAEHGLINAKITHYVSDDPPSFGPMLITAAGLDFLANDGGLSAILGVVTIKLHDETVRQLLIHRIEAAPGDPSVKASLVAKVKELPGEALAKFTLDGLDAALASAPDLLDLFRGLLG